MITPREVRYSFKLMLEERSIEVWAYNLETVLAEKLETVISRNVTNTRMRDFTIYISSSRSMEKAFPRRCCGMRLPPPRKARNAPADAEGRSDFDEVEESPVMEKLWQSYQKNYSYAADLSWHTVMDSIRALYRTGGSV